jgi:hypothetical protein
VITCNCIFTILCSIPCLVKRSSWSNKRNIWCKKSRLRELTASCNINSYVDQVHSNLRALKLTLNVSGSMIIYVNIIYRKKTVWILVQPLMKLKDTLDPMLILMKRPNIQESNNNSILPDCICI